MADHTLKIGTYDTKAEAIARVNEAGAHAAVMSSGALSITYTQGSRGYVVTVSGAHKAVEEFKIGWR